MDRLTEKDISDFVSKVSPPKIKQFATGHLGVTNSEIEDIDGSNRGDIHSIKYQTILIWYNKDPRTRRELFDLCRTAVQKGVNLPYNSYGFLNPDENSGTDEAQATKAPLSKVPKPSGSYTSDKDPTGDPVTPKQGAHSSTKEPHVDPDDVYPTDPKHNNLLVLINQFTEERRGTEFDDSRIRQFFGITLNFTIQYRENLSQNDIGRVLLYAKETIEFAEKPYDRLVVVILSHGDENSFLTCETGGKRGSIPISDIISPFKADNFPTFAMKPKLFFFQACRGDREMGAVMTDDKGLEPARIETDIIKQIPLPADANILIGYATTQDHVVYRNTNEGSWFIQSLVTVFEKNYKKEHVMDMLTKVKRLVAQKVTNDKKQIPCTVTTLCQNVFLTHIVPGGEARK